MMSTAKDLMSTKNICMRNILCVAHPKGEALLWGPNAGFWPDDFTKKHLAWVPYLD